MFVVGGEYDQFDFIVVGAGYQQLTARGEVEIG